jgi:hypothetical protein
MVICQCLNRSLFHQDRQVPFLVDCISTGNARAISATRSPSEFTEATFASDTSADRITGTLAA